MNKFFRISNPKLLRTLLAIALLLLVVIFAALYKYGRPKGEVSTLNVSAMVCHYISEQTLELTSINDTCTTASWTAPSYVAEFEGCEMTNVGYTLQNSNSSAFTTINKESTTYNSDTGSISSDGLYQDTYYYRARFFDPENTENVSKWSDTISCYNESASVRPAISLGAITAPGEGGGGSGIAIANSASSSSSGGSSSTTETSDSVDSTDEVKTITHESGTSENRDNGTDETPEYTDINADSELFVCVNELSNDGVFSGYPDGSFRPNNPINRAELAKVIINSFSGDEVNLSEEYTVSVFKDTYTTEWYYNYVQKAYEKGIIQGFSKESYQPEGIATRAHVLKMALIASGADYTETSGTELPFTDLDPKAWYMEYIPFAYENGIIQGYSDGSFRPDQSITRAETACIIQRTRAL